LYIKLEPEVEFTKMHGQQHIKICLSCLRSLKLLSPTELVTLVSFCVSRSHNSGFSKQSLGLLPGDVTGLQPNCS